MTDSPAFYEERLRLLQAENQRQAEEINQRRAEIQRLHDALDPQRIVIGDQLDALLQKLGFPDRNIVAEIRIGLQDATVLYYPLNENGKKYVAADGEAATRWRKIRVST